MSDDGPLTAEEMQHLTAEELEAYNWARAVFRLYKKIESLQQPQELQQASEKPAQNSFPEG